METMLQGLVLIAGLTFSVAAALLIEELIFGRIFRVVFARRTVAVKSEVPCTTDYGALGHEQGQKR